MSATVRTCTKRYTTLDVDSAAIAFGVPYLAHHQAGYDIIKYVRVSVGFAVNRVYRNDS